VYAYQQAAGLLLDCWHVEALNLRFGSQQSHPGAAERLLLRR
jgi:hypothetical protein